MKRLLFAACLIAGVTLFSAPLAEAQDFQWGLIDGTQANPTRIRGNLNATIVRQGVGSYRLTFTVPVFYVQVTSQAGGPGGDAAPTLASVTYDTSNPRIIYVGIFGIRQGGAPATTELYRTNARFSIEMRR
jgi:hypothetical protein